jgi:hypothetical protein
MEMGRSSNDDRSDSMNPNNDAYWASEENHRNQTGYYDDDESVSSATQSSTSPKLTIQSFPLESSGPRIMDVEVVCPPIPVRIRGVHMLAVGENGEMRRFKVNAPSIEEAVNDAANLCKAKPLTYFAVYDREVIYFEHSKAKFYPTEVRQAMEYLEKLEQLIHEAGRNTAGWRRDLDKDVQIEGRQIGHFHANLEKFGGSLAAEQCFRAEREERLQALRALGINATVENAKEIGKEGRMARLLSAWPQWVRDYQAGKAKEDAVIEAMLPSLRIMEIPI